MDKYATNIDAILETVEEERINNDIEMRMDDIDDNNIEVD